MFRVKQNRFVLWSLNLGFFFVSIIYFIVGGEKGWANRIYFSWYRAVPCELKKSSTSRSGPVESGTANDRTKGGGRKRNCRNSYILKATQSYFHFHFDGLRWRPRTARGWRAVSSDRHVTKIIKLITEMSSLNGGKRVNNQCSSRGCEEKLLVML